MSGLDMNLTLHASNSLILALSDIFDDKMSKQRQQQQETQKYVLVSSMCDRCAMQIYGREKCVKAIKYHAPGNQNKFKKKLCV